MKLFHKSDIALETIDERDELEKAIQVNTEFYLPSSAKGIVKLINEETAAKLHLKIGDKVYFDPRMLIEIEELNLVIVDEKSILLKE